MLANQTIPDLRFYAVLSLPGAVTAAGRLAPPGAEAAAARARANCVTQQALHSLELATTGLIQSLTELGVQASPLDRQATIDLLWRCANPDWSPATPPQPRARPIPATCVPCASNWRSRG